MNERIVYAQMHCHSRYSINSLSGEGVFHKFIWPLERQTMKLLMKTPTGLLRLANKKGVRFVAVTDHNRIPEIAANNDFLITGEEWGQLRGHSNFLSLRETVEPECGYYNNIEPEEPKDFPSAAIQAKKFGAFVSINHPFKTDSWQWGEESYDLVDALEVWNGPWGIENAKALELWQSLLVKGLRIWCMAGNDFHLNHLFNIDSQVVALLDTDSKASLIAKLRKGEYSIARDTRSPVIFLGADLRYSIDNYEESAELRIVSSDRTEKILNPRRDGLLERNDFKGFVRLELWEGEIPLSFSNPIFL